MPPREFDEIENYENPNFRWVSLIVLLLAVAGFLSLAWYAYQTGSDHRADGEVVVIEADDRSVKEIPEDRGGMEFPHQDKTIYRVLSPKQQEAEDVRVMPKPEAPDRPEGEPAQSEAADRKVAQIIKKAVEDTQRDIARHQESGQAVPASKPEPEPKPAPEPAPEPEPQAQAEPAPAARAPSAQPLSGVLVQLGAFRSRADARDHWEKLRRQHPDIVGGLEHTVIRADLGEKGIYYRLRAGGFASQAVAGATCQQLSKRQQACFVVK